MSRPTVWSPQNETRQIQQVLRNEAADHRIVVSSPHVVKRRLRVQLATPSFGRKRRTDTGRLPDQHHP